MQQANLSDALNSLKEAHELILQLETQAPDVLALLKIYEAVVAAFEQGLAFAQQNDAHAALASFQKFRDASKDMLAKFPTRSFPSLF